MKKMFLFPFIFVTVLFLFLWVVAGGFGFLGTDYHPMKNAPFSQTKPQKNIRLLHNGAVLSLPLEQYLYGVVAAEMPASFEIEALKAQAVAARTYTINRSRYPNKDHPDADVCSDSAHCKAYLTEDELKEKFQNQPEYLQKIVQAVDQTSSQIVVYQGEPISAVFHSTSSGMTENSKDVWGGDVPYLVSVVSEGEEASPRFTETKVFSPEEFSQKINEGTKKVNFSSAPSQWFSNWEKNPSGSTKSLTVCGTPFSGTELRSLLGLRSTNFELSVTDQITVTTKGYGHGVGMSQYGANDMAKRGYSYVDILKKYYTGVEITGL